MITFSKKSLLVLLLTTITITTGFSCTNDLVQNKPIPEPTEINKHLDSGYIQYTNTDIGTSFEFLERFSDLHLDINEVSISGTFNNMPDAYIVGGINTNFETARSAYYMDLVGFTQENDTFYLNTL
jgi:hypothetical protein